MRPLRTIPVLLLSVSCLTPSARSLANLERVEAQHAELSEAVVAQRAKAGPAYEAASRSLDPALDRSGCSVRPAVAGAPVRFDAGGRKFRVSAQDGACRVVSP